MLPDSNAFPSRIPKKYGQFVGGPDMENYKSCENREEVIFNMLMEEVELGFLEPPIDFKVAKNRKF